MKKLISILLCTLLILSSVSVTAFSATQTEIEQANDSSSYLYKDMFKQRYGFESYTDEHLSYDELYYHNDENGDVDWALIYANAYNCPPWNYHIVFKDRVLMYGTCTPFSFGYGLYDVKQDKFFDIISDSNHKYEFNFNNYEGLEEVFESSKIGYPIGDADLDKVLSIADATFIQRVLAKISDFKYDDLVDYYHGYKNWDELGYPKYISDVNCDGERDILDATAIQMKLAKLY